MNNPETLYLAHLQEHILLVHAIIYQARLMNTIHAVKICCIVKLIYSKASFMQMGRMCARLSTPNCTDPR